MSAKPVSSSQCSYDQNYANASLYVGDLAPDVTEAMLFEKFSSCGSVVSIRICRDLMTGESLRYGYVNFEERSEADKAMAHLNFDVLNGRQMRVMRSQRDPSLRKSGVGNVFVKNLDQTIDNSVLMDTFSTFGPILSCKVSQDSNGLSRGFGFVHFESSDSAKNAISKVNGMLVNGKQVFVGKFVPKSERQNNNTNKSFTNIYVKHLSPEYSDQTLRQLFIPFGNVMSAKVMTDDSGKSKGFGFVSFEDSDMALNACKHMNGKDMSYGKCLYVSRAQRKDERQEELRRRFEQLRLKRIDRYKGVNLYVKNLQDFIDERRLTQQFSIFGTITSTKIMADSSNRSKGFGFVCFSTPEEAQKAVNQMNNRIIGTKPLYVAIAQRKQDRKAFLISQSMQRIGGAELRMQAMSGQPQHQHHLQPHAIPTAAVMSFASNPEMALNGFRTGIATQMPHSWNDMRLNRGFKFY